MRQIDFFWDGPSNPTARERLAQEIVRSHRDAERIARRRRLRRKAQRRAHVKPIILALFFLALLVIGLWGTTPQLP